MPLELLPAGVLLGGALIALLLEVAGAPAGFRKRAERAHLPWLVAIAGAAAAGAAVWARTQGAVDALGVLGCSLASGLVVLAHAAATAPLRALDEERGEMSAAFLLLGAGTCAAVVARDLVPFAGGVVLLLVAGTLLAAPDREGPHGIEAAARLVVIGAVLLALLAFAAALSVAATGGTEVAALVRERTPAAGAAVALVLVAVLALLGAVPLQPRFVDTAHGSSSSSSGLLAGAVFVAAGVFAVRLLADGSPSTSQICAAVAVLSLVGAPLAALAQVRVGRLTAYLCATQTGVLLTALAAGHVRAAVVVIVVGALASSSSLLGVTLATRHPAATWEDWSGYGRARPVVAALFIYALATCAGMPGTPGFLARLDAARAAFGAGFGPWLGLLCVASTALAAAPVVRLALFLFAKERSSTRKDGEPPAFAFVAGVALLAVLAAWPDVLREIARLTAAH